MTRTGLKEEVVRLRKSNLCMTGTNISKMVGVSKERVRQILVDAGLPNAKFVEHHFICNNCGKKFYSDDPHLYCSRQCWSESHHVKVVCSECGKMFDILRSKLIARMRGPIVNGKRSGRIVNEIFCSRKCHGSWTGRNYGFGAKNRYPYQHIRVAWLCRLGFTGKGIIRMTGCGNATIWRVIHGKFLRR